MTKNIKCASETMEKLFLERNQTGDITFLVESEQIRAHRNILAALSPKYKAQFYGPNPDEGEIRVPDVSAAAFNVFLEFFYKETVDLTMDNIEMVLDLAKHSLVDEFVECCVNYLKDAIKANNNLCMIYKLATLYDTESLRLECEERISINTMNVFRSNDFLQWDRQMLLQILEMDSLNWKETYVFNACIAWAREHCKRNSLDDKKAKNLRAALGDALYQIRFSSINAEEYATLHNSVEGFFMSDESTEILYIIDKLKGFKPKNFNPKPRNLKTPPVLWSLECNRFLAKNEQVAESSKIDDIKIFFDCETPIRLHGFALGIHFEKADLDSFLRTISGRISYNDGPCVKFQSGCKVYQSPTSEDETIIIFDKPIENVTYLYCRIRIHSLRLDYKLILKPNVEVDNIYFSYLIGKWLTRIFFDKL